jgi:hypothetical protein
MAGRILVRDDKIIRFGQNNSYNYGDGVTICNIVKLSPSEYVEKVIDKIAFNNASGPHTVDFFEQSMIFDYYVVRFSLLSWYRRLAPLFFIKFG